MKVTCKICSAGYQVPDELAGRRIRCKNCGNAIGVRGGDESSNDNTQPSGDSEDLSDEFAPAVKKRAGQSARGFQPNRAWTKSRDRRWFRRSHSYTRAILIGVLVFALGGLLAYFGPRAIRVVNDRLAARKVAVAVRGTVDPIRYYWAKDLKYLDLLRAYQIPVEMHGSRTFVHENNANEYVVIPLDSEYAPVGSNIAPLGSEYDFPGNELAAIFSKHCEFLVLELHVPQKLLVGIPSKLASTFNGLDDDADLKDYVAFDPQLFWLTLDGGLQVNGVLMTDPMGVKTVNRFVEGCVYRATEVRQRAGALDEHDLFKVSVAFVVPEFSHCPQSISVGQETPVEISAVKSGDAEVDALIFAIQNNMPTGSQEAVQAEWKKAESRDAAQFDVTLKKLPAPWDTRYPKLFRTEAEVTQAHRVAADRLKEANAAAAAGQSQAVIDIFSSEKRERKEIYLGEYGSQLLPLNSVVQEFPHTKSADEARKLQHDLNSDVRIRSISALLKKMAYRLERGDIMRLLAIRKEYAGTELATRADLLLREDEAQRLLRKARRDVTSRGNLEFAEPTAKRIVKEFPDTVAAEEARAMLEKRQQQIEKKKNH